MVRFVSLVMAFLLAAVTPAFAADAPCKVAKGATLPIRVALTRLLTDVSINGQKVPALIDTGAQRTLLLKDRAQSLGVPLSASYGGDVVGVGGYAQTYIGKIKTLQLGESSAKNVNVLAIDSAFGSFFGAVLILGQDVLHVADLEIDVRGGELRFYKAIGACSGRSLAYWGPASAVDLEAVSHQDGAILFKVEINGKTFRAALDTGAPRTIITTQAAKRIGVTPDDETVVALGQGGGVGSLKMDVYSGAFEQITIGDEIIKHPHFTIGDMFRGQVGPNTPDMLLGMDFIRAHRLFVAHSQRKLYFSYLGGPVFPAPRLSPNAPAGDQSAADPP